MSMVDEQRIDAAYNIAEPLIERQPVTAIVTFIGSYVNQIGQGRYADVDVCREIANSEAFKGRELNREFFRKFIEAYENKIPER